MADPDIQKTRNTHRDLTILSWIGLLGLAGILVNDSIILVTRLDERLKGLRHGASGLGGDDLHAMGQVNVGGAADDGDPRSSRKRLQREHVPHLSG